MVYVNIHSCMLAGTTRLWQSDTSLAYQTLLFLRVWAICQTNVTTYIARNFGGKLNLAVW